MTNLGVNQEYKATFRSGIPFVWAPTGTVAANGAITLGTALPLTYTNCFMLLPAGAAFPGSPQGWYFVQMSSTTVGQIFNNLYVAPGNPSIPSPLVPIVNTGPGAYTGITVQTAGPQFVIPPNTLGVNGVLHQYHAWQYPNNANTKTLTAQIGGSNIFNLAPTTTANSVIERFMCNRGVVNAQVEQPIGSTGPGTGAGALQQFTFNFANPQTYGLFGTLAVATDFIVLESYMLELMP